MVDGEKRLFSLEILYLLVMWDDLILAQAASMTQDQLAATLFHSLRTKS
jgi:hypothetical protein